jgi:hypothetical protein
LLCDCVHLSSYAPSETCAKWCCPKQVPLPFCFPQPSAHRPIQGNLSLLGWLDDHQRNATKASLCHAEAIHNSKAPSGLDRLFCLKLLRPLPLPIRPSVHLRLCKSAPPRLISKSQNPIRVQVGEPLRASSASQAVLFECVLWVRTSNPVLCSLPVNAHPLDGLTDHFMAELFVHYCLLKTHFRNQL